MPEPMSYEELVQVSVAALAARLDNAQADYAAAVTALLETVVVPYRERMRLWERREAALTRLEAAKAAYSQALIAEWEEENHERHAID